MFITCNKNNTCRKTRNPISPTRWEDPDLQIWELTKEEDFPIPIMQIVYKLTYSYHSLQFLECRNHYDGCSLSTNICWEKVLTRSKALKDKHLYLDLAILETVQAGASWPIDRVAQQLEKENVCPLCGQTDVDKWHKYWTCPKILEAASNEKAIENSAHLKDLIFEENTAVLNRALVCVHQIETPTVLTR